MVDFVDREIAIRNLNMLLAERTTPWIVLSGKSKIGKTEFAKKIVSMHSNSILCKPSLDYIYAYSFVYSLHFHDDKSLLDVVRDFVKQDATAQNIIKSLGVKYAAAIEKPLLSTIIKKIINNDIANSLYTFARFVSLSVISEISCIFLDDFHRCDMDSYSWILECWQNMPEPHPTVISICNFELPWESSSLQNSFRSIVSPISVDNFDTELAFYEILKDSFSFENEINVAKVAKQLFALYDGSSKLLFETIKLLDGKKLSSNDDDTIKDILAVAQRVHLRSFREFNKIYLMVLRLLAYSPNPITKQSLVGILELNEQIATDILNSLYEGNYINQVADNKTGKTKFCINDDFLIDIIIGGCSEKERLFFKVKVFHAIQKKLIDASLEQKLELAIAADAEDAVGLLLKFMDELDEAVSKEKKAYYTDCLLKQVSAVPKRLVTDDIVRLLYSYGYYRSAEKIMQCMAKNYDDIDFKRVLLLGDIQHLLLSSEASQTYKRASEIPGICISDRLKALNRQIMALNQEHQEEMAKELYHNAFEQYESQHCVGLVELYRNSNNSYGYDEAIHYTIKGYFLAKELHEELEMYKCLHNICMLQLQYGYYGKPFVNNPIGFEPTFERVLEYLSCHAKYKHERAYPLLDLGTVKMFEYVRTGSQERLTEAKKYYSEAQLYARSFYAMHIAETGLLIVNSYLYHNRHPSFVQVLRNNMYSRYSQQKHLIEDYRVHRKILLSLAVSAVITKDMNDANEYLELAQQFIVGKETNRYNRLCKVVGCQEFMKKTVPINSKQEIYYGSEKFVPWLISFCH